MVSLHRRRDVRIQLSFLATLAVVYLLLAVYWVPPQNRLLLPLGLVAFSGAAWVGFTHKVRSDFLTSPMGIWALSLLLFVLIPVAGPPGPRDRGFLTGFVGVFCALGVWAVYRYSEEYRKSGPGRPALIGSVLWGMACGAGLALVYSLIALVIAIISLAGDQSLFAKFAIFYIVAAYWVGGILGGGVVGLLRPIARWPLGTMLIGIPAAIAIYAAVGTAMVLMEKAGINVSRHDPGTFTLEDQMWMIFSIGAVAGPMGALYFRDQWDG